MAPIAYTIREMNAIREKSATMKFLRSVDQFEVYMFLQRHPEWLDLYLQQMEEDDEEAIAWLNEDEAATTLLDMSKASPPACGVKRKLFSEDYDVDFNEDLFTTPISDSSSGTGDKYVTPPISSVSTQSEPVAPEVVDLTGDSDDEEEELPNREPSPTSVVMDLTED